MASKAQNHNNEKPASKQQPPQPDVQNLEEFSEQLSPATLIQQAMQVPNSLRPGDVLQMQQTIGNQGVRRLLENRTSVSTNMLQRSPLSDELETIWQTQGKGQFFDRLRRLNVSDADVATFVNRTLQGDDLWLAQRILTYGPEPLWPQVELRRRHERAARNNWPREPGHIEGVLDYTDEGRPITAYFFPGQTSEPALVIAGVHGTERQGIQVAEMLMEDLRNSPIQPHYSVIVVPTLFPDSQAHGNFGRRESGVFANDAQGNREEVPTNRNFPAAGQTLAQSQGRDADGRPILRENVALISLIERFNPTRIISIHGTTRPHRAGLFVDPVRGQERRDRQLSIAAAQQVVTNIQGTESGGSVTRGTGRRSMGSGRDSLQGDIGARMRRGELPGRRSSRLSQSEQQGLAETAAVAGNQLFLGAGNENPGWSGSVPGGVSLGGYGPARGMTVFTVEPAINRNTADYAAGNTGGDRLSEAERRIELQAYADAIRTVLLGDSNAVLNANNQPASSATTPPTTPVQRASLARNVLEPVKTPQSLNTIQLSELSDQLGAVWRTARKGAFFHQLRALSQAERTDPDLARFVETTLRGDDRWLAQNILEHGVERDWPVELRVEREMKGWGDSGGPTAVIRIVRELEGAEAGNSALESILRRDLAGDPDTLTLALWLQQNEPARLMRENEALDWLRDNSIPFTTVSRGRVAFSPAITVNFSNVVSGFEMHYGTSGERGTHTVRPRLAVALVRLIQFLAASDVRILHQLGVSGGTHAQEGYAIDIAGFSFSDGTRILLSGNRRESAWYDERTTLSNGMTAREFMIHIGEWMANTDFGQILGPGIGRGGHYNHFHVQVPRGRQHRGFVHE